MLPYQQKQHNLFEKIEREFREGKNPSTLVDFQRNHKDSNQICLTSVAFISSSLQEIIASKIIDPLRKIDGRQYFYLPQSLHITIQNIRTAHEPPLFDKKDITRATKVFSKIIPKHSSFSFKLKGLFELPTGFSIRAFADKKFRDLALKLRKELKGAGVPDNKKYASKTTIFGNATVARYTQKPSPGFIKKIKELKNEEIGEMKVKEIHLITTNAVCSPNKTKVIEKYSLD